MHIVLDSNIFLHYKSFEEIPWQEELGCEDITIILTAIVLEEIDKKKDEEKGKIQKRAKTVTGRFKDILLLDQPCKYPILFVESATASEEEKRTFHLERNDNQILFDVKQAGIDIANVTIVSADTAMLLRAKQLGYRIFQPNDKYLLKEEQSLEDKFSKELERIKNRMPDPKLMFDGGCNHITIQRVSANDIEKEVSSRMKDLRMEWPERKVEDEQIKVMDMVFNSATPEMIMNYNNTRNKFFEQSEKKIRLEVKRDEYDRRMKEISIVLANKGTASTGKMNIFLAVPDGVKIYDKGCKKKESYEAPSAPNYYGITNNSYINPIVGYYKPNVLIWDMSNPIHDRELRKVSEPLTHNLQQNVFSFYVDSANCPNFKLSWVIVDAALPDSVHGELNVSFVNE